MDFPITSRSAATLSAYGKRLLGTCCQFNAFLIEQRISRCSKLSEAMAEPFLKAFVAFAPTTHARFWPRLKVRAALKHLFTYLSKAKVCTLPRPKRVRKPYHWLLDRYLQHRRSEGKVTELTVRKDERLLSAFLEALGKDAQHKRFKRLQPEKLETFLKEHLRSSTENPGYLVSALRQFFRYCAAQQLLSVDFSGLVPPIRRYRHASIPKGMADSDLERVLTSIPQDTPVGARDYAILVLLMAYGIRGVSAAQLLLDDIDWQHSRIRIRAQKGGKEVLLPLMGAVGEAIIRYLPHRYSKSPSREVFLSAQAPFKPFRSGAISMIVHRLSQGAGSNSPTAALERFVIPGPFVPWPTTPPSRPSPMSWGTAISTPPSSMPRPTSKAFGRWPCRGQPESSVWPDRFFAVFWRLDWRPF